MKRAAIITENGFEESELTSPKKAMEDAGIKVDIISPQKEKVKGWNHDHWSIELPVDVNITFANTDDYDALVIPGGVMNPDKMRANEECVILQRNLWKQGNLLLPFAMARNY
jgi:Putative intracellular protease/amidase